MQYLKAIVSIYIYVYIKTVYLRPVGFEPI